MNEHDDALAAELERTFPAPAAAPDWRAIRREALRGRIRVAGAAVLVFTMVFGVLPALGVGRDVLWPRSEDDKTYGYTVAAVETVDGRVEFVATRGIHMGLSVWLDGERLAASGGPDDSLHGRGTEGPRYLGWFAGRAGPKTQFAFSPIAREVATVEVLLADGSVRPAEIVPPPPTVRTTLRFYYVTLEVPPRLAGVRARDASGRVLEEHSWCCGAGTASRGYRRP